MLITPEVYYFRIPVINAWSWPLISKTAVLWWNPAKIKTLFHVYCKKVVIAVFELALLALFE